MKRVFVVDDDPQVVELMTMVLADEGYEVAGFTSGAEALVAMRREPPALLFLDLLMPGLDGSEVCHILKSDTRLTSVRVVILSGYGYLEQEAVAAGADGYLLKPFDLDDMIKQACLLIGPAVRELGVG